MNLADFAASFAAGTKITLELGLAAFAVGLAIGLACALLSRSRFAIVRGLILTYTTLFRGIPELLIIFLVYFGGTVVLSALFKDYVEVGPMTAGISSLGIVSGAYCTEVIRAAFNAIPKGQVEAAIAFGMPRLKILMRIEMPQMWRFALPGLGNLWLGLLKDTALVSIVGLDDIMRKSKTASEFTKQPFTYYLAAAVLYLAITTLSAIAIEALERNSARGVRGTASLGI